MYREHADHDRRGSGRQWSRLRPIHLIIGLITIAAMVFSGLTATGASLAQLSRGSWFVVLGDSYSSGEGVPPFIGGSDTPANRCHRSTQSYGEDLAGTPGFPSSIAAIACSGAKIANFYAGKGQYDEREGQLADLSALSPGVSVVAMTLGGNDVEFAPILETCVVLIACQRDLNAPTLVLIANTVRRLDDVYRKVLTDAPNAQVYVLGYPHFFSPHPSILCNGIDFTEAHWITAMEDLLDAGVAADVHHIHSARLHYVDTATAFAGGELCSAKHPIYMNGIIKAHTEYSFHPTAAGQQRLADALARAVRG